MSAPDSQSALFRKFTKLVREYPFNEKQFTVAIALAHGKTKEEAANEAGISRQTVYNWLSDPDFAREVDMFSEMAGAAAPAFRMRIINRLIAQKIRADGSIETKADITELLKLAQSESNGKFLDLQGATAILEAENEQNTPPPTPPSEPELSSEQVS